MTAFLGVASFKPQPSDNDLRLVVTWIGPDGIQREYTVNQRTLNRYTSEAEAKAALDAWTQKSFLYTLNDIFFHRNRDGTWAIATSQPPLRWPEDEPKP